jgi:hypothetical protein
MASGPACQAYWNTDAVFDARVVDIESVRRQDELVGQIVERQRNLVTLDVRQAWKGATAGKLQVLTETSSASCGFEFQVGRRYLVFARMGAAGILEVSYCSATREFDGTGPDAEFLTSLGRPAAGGRIFGRIDAPTPRAEGGLTPPMPGDVVVTLTWQGRSRTTKAVGGIYEFTGLAPGTYEVRATVPTGYTAHSWPSSVPIPTTHACFEQNVGVGYAARITGQLVDAKGRGVRGVNVQLVGSDTRLPLEFASPQRTAYSIDAGFFEFGDVAPGAYLVGINLEGVPSEYRPHPLTVYPGGGLLQTVHIELGSSIDLGRWEVPPPVPEVRITGQVVWPDGSPAAGY